MISSALELLQHDRLQYADMINLLSHADQTENLEILCADSRGVLFRANNHLTMTALFEKESAPELLDMLGQPGLITSHQEWSEPLIEDTFGPIKHNTRCSQMVYTGTSPLQYSCTIEIRPLTAEYIPLAASYYNHGEKYLHERMQKGVLFGGFLGSEMVGFIGLHAEEAIGMLEVLPEHRRKGYASMLESYMINLQLSRGYIPYCHVIHGNDASMSLQRSLGLVPAGQPVSWISTRYSQRG